MTPTEAREQLLPLGLQGREGERNGTAAAGDVLLQWEESLQGGQGGKLGMDVPQASPNG